MPLSDQIRCTVIAVGICVLLVWIVRRGVRPTKLSLANTPGRPNNLNPGHILVALVTFLLTMYATGRVLAWYFPPEDPRIAAVAGLPALAVLLAASLLVARATFRFRLRNGMGLNLRHWMFDSGRGVLGVLAVLPICLGLSKLTKLLMPENIQHTHDLLTALPALPVQWKLVVIFSAVVMAPLAEEVFFRGLLQSMVRSRTGSPWVAILTTSLFFSLMHLRSPQDAPPLFVLSVVLGYNYERCGRLYPPILIHALFNGLNIAVCMVETASG